MSMATRIYPNIGTCGAHAYSKGPGNIMTSTQLTIQAPFPTLFPGKIHDTCHKLEIEGFDGGLVVMNVTQGPDPTKAAYLAPCMESIQTSDETKLRLGIFGITPIKCKDGRHYKTIKLGSNIPAKQFVAVVGTGKNTPEIRRDIADSLIEYLNQRATTEHYKWPKKTVFWTDRTTNPKRKISSVMMDKDVLDIIKAAYHPFPVRLMADSHAVAEFWEDTNYGYHQMLNSGD